MSGKYLPHVFITGCVTVVKEEILLENILNIAQTDGEHSGSLYFIMNTGYPEMLSIVH